MDPNPGACGLYIPGYYLVALHFRMIPLGFEPLSVMLNEGDSRWGTSRRSGTRRGNSQAKDIAACCNEALLIYFASDYPQNLRPQAMEKLDGIGRVVFGNNADEVGHMSQQWTDQTRE